MYPLPDLHTERTVVRLLRPGDVALLRAYRVDNREHLGPWEPVRDAEYYTDEASLRMIAGALAMAQEDRAYAFGVFDPAQTRMLASFTFSNVARGIFQACHLGYGVAADCQGRGLMHEALQAGLGLAFGELELHRVMANYMPRNARSAALLERLGFQREGLARRYLKIGGVWEDHILTARIAED
jgi:[ribosomal protein S5]-alanine N-acetyltransferase